MSTFPRLQGGPEEQPPSPLAAAPAPHSSLLPEASSLQSQLGQQTRQGSPDQEHSQQEQQQDQQQEQQQSPNQQAGASTAADRSFQRQVQSVLHMLRSGKDAAALQPNATAYDKQVQKALLGLERAHAAVAALPPPSAAVEADVKVLRAAQAALREDERAGSLGKVLQAALDGVQKDGSGYMQPQAVALFSNHRSKWCPCVTAEIADVELFVPHHEQFCLAFQLSLGIMALEQRSEQLPSLGNTQLRQPDRLLATAPAPAKQQQAPSKRLRDELNALCAKLLAYLKEEGAPLAHWVQSSAAGDVAASAAVPLLAALPCTWC